MARMFNPPHPGELLREFLPDGMTIEEVAGRLGVSRVQLSSIVQEKGLAQVSDTGAIEKFCDDALAANPKSVADYKSGNVIAINFLKGQVMKLSKGKANPALVGEILERKLKG